MVASTENVIIAIVKFRKNSVIADPFCGTDS